MSHSLRSRGAIIGLLVLIGCGQPAPSVAPQPTGSAPPMSAASAAPPTPVAAPAATMPRLRTGPVLPVEHAEPLAGKVVARHLGPDAEILGIELPALPTTDHAVVHPDTPTGSPRPLAFIHRTAPSAELPGIVLWVRRPKAAAGEPMAGDIYLPAGGGRERWERDQAGLRPGERYRFTAEPALRLASSPKLQAAWAAAFATALRDQFSPGWPAGPWHAFAADRVLRVFGAPDAPPSPRAPVVPFADQGARSDELSLLMETTTGMSSIQETFQSRRRVMIAAARQPRNVPISSVAGPRLASHPFERMLGALRKPVPDEPLARSTPADCYYLRFATIELLFRLLDELDAWATPAVSLLERRAADHGLSARYEAELGLGRGPLSRALGPEVVESLAVVGSDPYVREGTDLTILFRVRSHPLFEAGIAAALATHAERHGPMERRSEGHGGVTIRVAASADGAVRQQRATVGDLEIVSNSPAAIRRVLDAIAGKRPRLADEPDFRYMLTRDAEQNAALGMLGFAGDRFVAQVIGPAQKILEARRQLALGELLTPGYAAMLYGWIHGRSPATVDALVQSGLLARSELAHADGQPIQWQPAAPARSSWGTAAALTPLVDLPAPTNVTAAERDGYLAFVRGYEMNWSTMIDPILLGLGLSPARGTARSGSTPQAGPVLEVHLRTLPLIEGTEYREIEAAVGQARVTAAPLERGLRVVLGIGREAELRRELRGLLGELPLPGRHRIEIDWLGEWAAVGVADDPSLAAALRDLHGADLPERPLLESESAPERPDELGTIARVPVYAAVDLRNAAAAGVALLAVRAMAESALPDMVSWAEHERYRDVAVVRVAVRPEGRRRGERDRLTEQIEIYYALCDGALLLALQPQTARWLIDQRLDRNEPRAAGSDPSQGQLLVDLAGTRDGALYTVIDWLLEQAAAERGAGSRADAEIVLRGAPELADNRDAIAALARATLGSVPLTPDGQRYGMSPSGVRDPVRGTAYAPIWPALPVAGSPTTKLLDAVGSFRSEIAFDDEGKTPAGERMQSLRVALRIGLRR